MYKKAIFHVHTYYSFDAFNTIPFLIDTCLKNGIQVLSVADHNNMDAYSHLLEYSKLYYPELKIIPSQEINIPQGSLIGMFLKKPIDSGLEIKQAIKEIKDQNGVVYLPKPYHFLNQIKDLSLDEQQSIIDDIDIFEGFSARHLRHNIKSSWCAKERNKLMLWACDAHFSFEIMNCIVSIPDFEMNRESFLKAVQKASLLFKKASYRGVLNSYILKKRLIKTNYKKGSE